MFGVICEDKDPFIFLMMSVLTYIEKSGKKRVGADKTIFFGSTFHNLLIL